MKLKKIIKQNKEIIIASITLIAAIIGVIAYSQDNSQKVDIEGDKNNTSQIQGSDNTVIQGNHNTVNATDFEDEEALKWKEASEPLQYFINKLNNRNFSDARLKLDKYLIVDPHFTEKELRHFMDNVDGEVSIRNLEYDNAINKDAEFSSNRGFYFFLRYLKDGQQIQEKWKAVTVKYNKEDNIWLIGKLKCEDKKCEDESLLAAINIQ